MFMAFLEQAAVSDEKRGYGYQRPYITAIVIARIRVLVHLLFEMQSIQLQETRRINNIMW
ncbi:hypothetical protein GLW08_10500 [Pontibacillus yanchengensis]|uniref:Uncharacterized protein n=2 Tax=Pontibacillus yanchengensis TaxID=462910 RepID=A0A6I4ZVW7_9BACI|nr:hypothetical protein [Pontibacillus yanchengensis]MYL34298.1 hypothetical protein [Pontibacillus yanchengensis]MYL53766.1 hypothetical protein [Pontibacillus yanchengensis]